MTELPALSVSVAVLGGIWAFIALGPLEGFTLVWVGFIAAGCFFAAGGDIKALSPPYARGRMILKASFCEARSAVLRAPSSADWLGR